MDQVKQSGLRNITQAYSQAPWRKQLQVIATCLMVVVFAAVIAGIYLSITSQAATLGRQIQDLNIRMDGSQRLDLVEEDGVVEEGEIDLFNIVPIEELYIQIADLQGQLAIHTSSTVMRERAEKMGFIPTTAEGKYYFDAPGYAGRDTLQLAPPSTPQTVETTTLASAYRESLIEWFEHKLALVSSSWKDANR